MNEVTYKPTCYCNQTWEKCVVKNPVRVIYIRYIYKYRKLSHVDCGKNKYKAQMQLVNKVVLQKLYQS